MHLAYTKSLGKTVLASKHLFNDLLEICVSIPQESNMKISQKATKWFPSATEDGAWQCRSATISLLMEFRLLE